MREYHHGYLPELLCFHSRLLLVSLVSGLFYCNFIFQQNGLPFVSRKKTCSLKIPLVVPVGTTPEPEDSGRATERFSLHGEVDISTGWMRWVLGETSRTSYYGSAP
jgi:hypothetical protein